MLIRPTVRQSSKADRNIGTSRRFRFLRNATSFRSKPGKKRTSRTARAVMERIGVGLGHAGTSRLAQLDDQSARDLEDAVRGELLIKNPFSPKFDKNWKDKVCSLNAADCNQNFPAINFSEFSGRSSWAL